MQNANLGSVSQNGSYIRRSQPVNATRLNSSNLTRTPNGERNTNYSTYFGNNNLSERLLEDVDNTQAEHNLRLIQSNPPSLFMANRLQLRNVDEVHDLEAPSSERHVQGYQGLQASHLQSSPPANLANIIAPTPQHTLIVNNQTAGQTTEQDTTRRDRNIAIALCVFTWVALGINYYYSLNDEDES
jgi:hypothetical protein